MTSETEEKDYREEQGTPAPEKKKTKLTRAGGYIFFRTAQKLAPGEAGTGEDYGE